MPSSKCIKSVLMMTLLAVTAVQGAEKPLLMEGKTSLYQKVLSTPSCVLRKDPAAKDGSAVPAFSRFYVYKRDGRNLQVGPDTTGKISGWLDGSCAVEWKMQTALMFTNPAGRDRALIFDGKDALDELVKAKDPRSNVQSLNDSLSAKKSAPHVLSQEPDRYIDFRRQFYLLPILDAEETMFDDGNYTRELKIASITALDDKKKTDQGSETSAIKQFKAAIVFVIDSSISMQPYIDRTKKAIETIYKRLEKEHLEDRVQFGLVSFRSNIKAVPGLEYTSRIFVNPGDANSSKEFAEKLKDLKQANVSSALFDEDAYSGINTALSAVKWNEFGGRYVVLMTDAGAIEGSNKLSSTKLDSKELRAEAAHQGVALYALHLLTESGKRNRNHDKAKAQYQDLTFNDVLQKSLYYPVDAGEVSSFGNMVDQLANSITNQVKLASEGKLGAGSAVAVAENSAKEQDSLDEDTRLLGYAMQLSYLGTVTGTKAPDFIEGWISDRDLVAHNKPVAEPVVLLTKLQLSDLKELTRHILDSANQGILNPEDMFSQLRSLAVSMGRDPASMQDGTSLKISSMGLLGEYLDGLPYKSRLQDLDEETWSSMGPDEQNQTIEDLENKLTYYQKCNDDTDRWVNLIPGADSSEAVYPVKLELLP